MANVHFSPSTAHGSHPDAAGDETRVPGASVDQQDSLALAIAVAEYRASEAEAATALLESKYHELNASVVGLRALAMSAGIPVSPARSVSPVITSDLTRAEFAAQMRISVRRVDQHRARMTEGVHFHRDGCRVLFRHPAASDFIRTSLGPLRPTENVEQLAIDEVTRRRARVALRRARSTGA